MSLIKYRLSPGPHHLKIGRLGEDLAVNMLASKGYIIIARNLKVAGREIDIIAMENQALVIIEVKTRSGQSFGPTILAVDSKRQERLRKAAQIYAAQKKIEPPSIRFDIVTVDFHNDSDRKLELTKNAF